ncbi:Lrp/AsnC ligand binding domain-containing protein [Saccharopolyspora shandongensis]|uniref:Lrp/AsnC ligand binding domain-containing protein n=1 Tax=Saccharopolyspora shandongensis TaxID=418495 RepID=UPI0033EA9A60
MVRAWTIAGGADALALIHARDTDHLEGIILRLQRIPVIAHTRPRSCSANWSTAAGDASAAHAPTGTPRRAGPHPARARSAAR